MLSPKDPRIPLDGLDEPLLRAPRDAGLTYFGTAAGADLGAVNPGHAGQYYQRVLPTAQVGQLRMDFLFWSSYVQQVPFASSEGRKLFKKALQAGGTSLGQAVSVLRSVFPFSWC